MSFALTRIRSDMWQVLVGMGQVVLIGYVTRRAWIEYFWYREDGPRSDLTARWATYGVFFLAVMPLSWGHHWLLAILPALSWRLADLLCIPRPQAPGHERSAT